MHDRALPFQFPFYGFAMESTLSIGTNGYITFGTGHFPYGNSYELPHPETLGGVNIDGMLAVMWTDINPGDAADGCGVWFQVSDEVAIVSYVCVPYWGDATTNTFQVLLYPNGVIHMNYLDLNEGGGGHGTPSIGIETAEGDAGISLAYGWPNVPADGTALEIVPDQNSCPCGEVPYPECVAIPFGTPAFAAMLTPNSLNAPTLLGHAQLTPHGLVMDGLGDAAVLESTQYPAYGADGTFSYGIWYARGSCETLAGHSTAWEYMIAHLSDGANPYAGISTDANSMTVSGYHVYMSCGAYRQNGWFISTGGYHFVNDTMGMPHTNFFRTIQSSANGVYAMYDMELHTDSSVIADGSWTHYVATISNSALINYMDGVAVPDTMYGLYGHNGDTYTVQNTAIPTLSSLRFEMDSYAFDEQPIVLGARAGFDREFGGALAGFTIYQDAVGPADVAGLYTGQWSIIANFEPFSPRTAPGCSYLQAPTPAPPSIFTTIHTSLILLCQRIKCRL